MGVDQNGTRPGSLAIGEGDGSTGPLATTIAILPGPTARRVRSENPRKGSARADGLKSVATGGAAERILDIVTELRADGSLLLFHDPSGEPYVRMSAPIVAGTRTLDIRSREFEQVLLGVSLARQRSAGTSVRAVSQGAWCDSCRTVAALAVHDGPSLTVFARVARLEDPPRVVIDLGDAGGRAVVVTGAGWVITDDPPVPFRRWPSMRALPVPEPGGDPGTLRNYVHVSDTAFPLVLAWMINALAGTVP